MSCSPVRDTAQVLRIRLGMPDGTISVTLHVSMYLITTPSQEFPLPISLPHGHQLQIPSLIRQEGDTGGGINYHVSDTY